MSKTPRKRRAWLVAAAGLVALAAVTVRNSDFAIRPNPDNGAAGNDSANLQLVGRTSVADRAMQLQNVTSATSDTYRLGVKDDAGNERVTVTNGGSVGIGNTGPAASAVLDVASTTQGVLLPRMTSAQRNAIGSPAAGLLVYDTTLQELYLFDGTIWKSVNVPQLPAGMMFLFDSACPGGWTEVAAFQNRLIRGHDGDGTFGEIGGADTHSHPIASHSHGAVTVAGGGDHSHSGWTGTPTSTWNQNSDGGSSVAHQTHLHWFNSGTLASGSFSHTHTLSASADTSTVLSTVPAYREFVVCSAPAGITIVPTGTIAIFQFGCPIGWSEVTTAQNRVARGHDNDASFGETGGVDSHSHGSTGHTHATNVYGSSHSNHTSGWSPGPTFGPSATGPGLTDSFGNTGSAATGGHTHNWSSIFGDDNHSHTEASTSAGSTADSHVPAYLEVVFCSKDSTSTAAVPPSGTLALFDGACPVGWSEDVNYRNRVLRGHDGDGFYGETGGADTHVHTVNHNHGGTVDWDAGHSHAFNFGGPSATIFGDGAALQTYASAGHTHSSSSNAGGSHTHTVNAEAPAVTAAGLAVYREAVVCRRD